MFQCYFHHFEVFPLLLQWSFHEKIFHPLMTFLLHLKKFNLLSCIDALPSVVFPDDVQPSYISAYDYPLCVNVQEPVYISRVVICISNKHACFPSIIQLGSHLFAFMYGNHCHFSTCSHSSHIFWILSIKQCVRGFCPFWPYHYVIQLCCCGNGFTPEFSFSL